MERRAGLFYDQIIIVNPNSRSDFDDTIYFGIPYTGATDSNAVYEIKENANNSGADFAISKNASPYAKYIFSNISASARKK